jgi:hypothetical protein
VPNTTEYAQLVAHYSNAAYTGALFFACWTVGTRHVIRYWPEGGIDQRAELPEGAGEAEALAVMRSWGAIDEDGIDRSDWVYPRL